MRYGVVFEEIKEADFPQGYYYAHIPSLGLTTHGKGLDGALSAAKDLIMLWFEEKKGNNETIAIPGETYYSVLDIQEYAI